MVWGKNGGGKKRTFLPLGDVLLHSENKFSFSVFIGLVPAECFVIDSVIQNITHAQGWRAGLYYTQITKKKKNPITCSGKSLFAGIATGSHKVHICNLTIINSESR